jgi:NAD+ synthase (glutamine-hydrolysing)
MQFRSLYRHGFARVAAATVPVALADPATNAATTLAAAQTLSDRGVVVAVFPELGLSGYAIEDLRQQDVLLDAVETAVAALVKASATLLPLILVGAPLRHRDRLFNCAVAIHRGRLLGVVPKIHLPNYREFYEARHFASGQGHVGDAIRIAGLNAPFGTDLLFAATDITGLTVHAEICEDVWIPIPPSSFAALSGATVLANLSASNITVGKARERDLLCRSQSARCLAAYLYAAAGVGESSTDVAWDGQVSIFENGECLDATERFPDTAAFAVADIDLDGLRQERMRLTSLDTNRAVLAGRPPFRVCEFDAAPPDADLGLARRIARFPFVPSDAELLERDCYEAYNIQVSALMQRLQAANIRRVVIGISGGLDSTQALLVAARAFDRLARPRTDIRAYTLPGFGTSDHTRANALALMDSLGVTAETIDIRPAATRMLADMRHPAADGAAQYDVTYENVQAGLRTDYLFRLANQHDAIVLGTGDLSELALGWCTYGVGDQMSHYNVNGGLPKTLIQHLIRWVIASDQFAPGVADTLASILATEITPELVPAAPGSEVQSTERIVGPYALQDFNLFHILRHGARPSRIVFLATHAWSDQDSGAWPPHFPDAKRVQYSQAEIKHWLGVFLRRYFGFSQFKRSAMPNGPKVLAGGSLSPRGDWRAPSDGNARAWLADLQTVPD